MSKKSNKKQKKVKQQVVKKNTNVVFKALVFIGLVSVTTFFLTGCISYHAECDQTKNGRGNVCKGLVYHGSNK